MEQRKKGEIVPSNIGAGNLRKLEDNRNGEIFTVL